MEQMRMKETGAAELGEAEFDVAFAHCGCRNWFSHNLVESLAAVV